MKKVKYTVLYETGNDFEPIDYYDEWVEIDENFPIEDDDMTVDYLNDLIENDYPNCPCWLCSYEVIYNA